MGVITPIGNTVDEFWESLINGRGGVDYITHIDTTNFSSKIGAEVKNFDPDVYIDRKDSKRMDMFCKFGMAAAIQAIEDSGLNFDNCDRERCGVIVGSGIGGMRIYEEQVIIMHEKGSRRISPFFIPMMIPDILPGHISIRYGLYGPNFSTTSACATSGHAIGCGVRSIRYGESDVIIAGGAEAPITAMGLGGFCSLKALSTRNDDPKRASRPFDAQRDGFLIGEGGAIIVLEAEEHARARNAKIYAEVCGIGFSGDAFHITAPPDDGAGAIRAMRSAIRDAGLKTEDIDYINAHGTSTPLNDKSETQAIKKLFGEHANNLLISSTKSMHGHLLGAAGSVELIATILAVMNDIVPPTINYEFPNRICYLLIMQDRY